MKTSKRKAEGQRARLSNRSRLHGDDYRPDRLLISRLCIRARNSRLVRSLFVVAVAIETKKHCLNHGQISDISKRLIDKRLHKEITSKSEKNIGKSFLQTQDPKFKVICDYLVDRLVSSDVMFCEIHL